MKCLNIPPSKKVGDILKTLFELWQDDKIENSRDKLIDAVKVIGGEDISLYETVLSDDDWNALMEALNEPKENEKLKSFMSEKFDVEIR